MPLYLAPYVGDGTGENPFRPRGSDQAVTWSSIDLRRDSTRAAGAALLWLPAPSVDPVLVLLARDKAASIAPDILEKVSTRLGVDMTGVVDAPSLLRRLLTQDQSSKICRPLAWSAKGTREVSFGRERWIQDTDGPKTTSTFDPSDSFTNSDGTALPTHNALWVENVGSFAINTNAVYSDNTATGLARWNETFADDQFSQATHAAEGGGTGRIGVATRIATDGASTAYFAFGRQGTSTDKVLGKRVTGTNTTLASSATDVIVGDIIRLESEGSTQRFLLNGSEILSATDTAIASGQAGLFSDNNSSTGKRLDDWSSGDIGAVAAPKRLLTLGVGSVLPLWPAWWRWQRMRDRKAA